MDSRTREHNREEVDEIEAVTNHGVIAFLHDMGSISTPKSRMAQPSQASGFTTE